MGSKRPNESVASDRATKKQQKQQKDQTAASTTEYRLSCPYACNLETGDGASLNHPCGGALTPFKDIAKLNEHLKRSHSLLYTCPDCMSPYQIVSKTSLEVLRRAHQTECKGTCDADQSRSPGRRPGKATGPMRMDPEQHSRWMKWREQEVAHIDGESTIKTNWRKIWKCLWPDAHPPAIITREHGVVPQPTTGPIPKEEDIITLDPALAQPADSVSPLDLPYAHRGKSDTFHETFWDSTNPSNALVVNSPSAVRIPPGFPYHPGGGNTMPDTTSDVIATSDDGRSSAGYFVQPHAGQQHLLPNQHNNPFPTYPPYPPSIPSMDYSEETYDFTTTTMLEDQRTGFDPQLLHPSSQASGGTGFDQHDTGIWGESTEPEATLTNDELLKDQNTSLLGIGLSNAVQDGRWMDNK